MSRARMFRLLLSLPLCLVVNGSADGPDLASGIRQVKDGDFEGALVTLDLVARQLGADPARTQELAQAYLYIGVAYLGLGQQALAKARFQRALQHDAALRPSPDEFPPKVLRSFMEARKEWAETAALQKEAKQKRGKGGLLLLGLGGVGAAGVALTVATKERENRPPTATLTIRPEGQAIASVTRMTFTANASDPDGEVLSYRWDFGDGDAAEGPVATHVFTSTTTHTVTLAVRDGLTTTTVTGTVTVREMTGRWRVAGQAFGGVTDFDILGVGGGNLRVYASGTYLGGGFVELADPRSVGIAYQDCRRLVGTVCYCQYRLDGGADPTLQTITGTLHCLFTNASPPCPCEGQSQPITLVRQ